MAVQENSNFQLNVPTEICSREPCWYWKLKGLMLLILGTTTQRRFSASLASSGSSQPAATSIVAVLPLDRTNRPHKKG